MRFLLFFVLNAISLVPASSFAMQNFAMIKALKDITTDDNEIEISLNRETGVGLPAANPCATAEWIDYGTALDSLAKRKGIHMVKKMAKGLSCSVTLTNGERSFKVTFNANLSASKYRVEKRSNSGDLRHKTLWDRDYLMDKSNNEMSECKVYLADEFPGIKFEVDWKSFEQSFDQLLTERNDRDLFSPRDSCPDVCSFFRTGGMNYYKGSKTPIERTGVNQEITKQIKKIVCSSAVTKNPQNVPSRAEYDSQSKILKVTYYEYLVDREIEDGTGIWYDSTAFQKAFPVTTKWLTTPYQPQERKHRN